MSYAVTKAKGEVYTLEERNDLVMMVAERIERGESIASYKLMELLKVTRPTAIRYRNAALRLINVESKAWNIDTVRNIEIGRLESQMSQLIDKLDQFGGKEDTEIYLKIVDKLNQTRALLHKITGVNSETTYNVSEQKRINVYRHEDKVQEAEIIEATPIDK